MALIGLMFTIGFRGSGKSRRERHGASMAALWNVCPVKAELLCWGVEEHDARPDLQQSPRHW